MVNPTHPSARPPTIKEGTPSKITISSEPAGIPGLDMSAHEARGRDIPNAATMTHAGGSTDSFRSPSAVSLEHPFPKQSARRSSLARTSIQQSVYIGIYFELSKDPKEPISFCICAHDGSFAVDYHISSLEPSFALSENDRFNEVSDKAITTLKAYAHTQHYKIHAVALNRKSPDEEPSDLIKRFAARLWFEVDAIPFLLYARGGEVDERADSLVRKLVMRMSPQYPGCMARIEVSHKHRVDVDLEDIIHTCGLEDYERATRSEYWEGLMRLGLMTRKKDVRITFFSSTPQGGGVALMRHALVRLCRLMRINAKWFVAKPRPEVFDITKRKFHNILQGVAPPSSRLTDDEKAIWADWVRQNVERNWLGERGPIMQSDIIVVDDPQLCAMIPMIKEANPKVKIIYRSHIELRADLIRKPGTPQAEVWDFLNCFISLADVFVAHPINNFVPDTVAKGKVVFMPAATDPIDGLNKSMNFYEMNYYKGIFNRISWDQNGSRLGEGRPYFVQVARFDPSKGIPDVLEAYRRFRTKLDSEHQSAYSPQPPQLVLCGHGSVDDPDGLVVYEQVMEIITSRPYADIVDDICVTRLPPCDQLLNTILRGAEAALQLSHREGFEIKITEAISKGVPVIAYAAGGIPHQIKDGEDGYLVPVGDIDGVVQKMIDIFTHTGLRDSLSQYGTDNNSGEFFTPCNLTGWLALMHELLDGRKTWERKWVKDLWLSTKSQA